MVPFFQVNYVYLFSKFIDLVVVVHADFCRKDRKTRTGLNALCKKQISELFKT